jgi:hypothetical protein
MSLSIKVLLILRFDSIIGFYLRLNTMRTIFSRMMPVNIPLWTF